MGHGREQGHDDERELVQRSQQGDRAAFNRLVELHQSGAFALALRMLGHADVAADVTQDAFLAAFRAIGRMRGVAFRPWLYRIVSNGCYDYWRAQGRRPSVSLEATLEDEDDEGQPLVDAHVPQALVDATWDPERAALRAEVIEQVEAALQTLPAEQRLALILSDIQGLAYEEIAQVMQCSLGTVKSRIARARARLRARLADVGGRRELSRWQGRPAHDGGR